MRRRVLMIHGIYSNGPWMQRVADILEPHFECHPISYSEYLGWKAIRVVFGIRSKRRALRRVRAGYDEATADHAERVHLIAHSFGTVLSADLMKTHPWVSFDRMIFVGSALPDGFPWQKIFVEDPGKFHHLRNETGQKDRVVRLAGMLQALRPGLGNAGYSGFRDGHDLKGPLLACDVCEEDVSHSKIHNVPLQEYGHSSMFLSGRHAGDLWLPWLWGFVPFEYRKFLELCHRAKRLQEEGAPVEAEIAMEELGRWGWNWVEVTSDAISYSEYVALVLSSYLKQRDISLKPQEIDELRVLALEGVCEGVVAAVSERKKRRSERSDERILALHPRIATARAVKELVDHFLV